MAPIVDGLAQQYKGKVSVRRINAETDPSAQELDVSAVPTYIFLDSTGKVIERQVGGNPSALEAGFQKAADSL
jgi:thioredoxin-like negative regulator of GroEL